jgi:hypothetical protein
MALLTFIGRFVYFIVIALISFLGILSTLLNTLQSLNGLLCVYRVGTASQSYSSNSFRGLMSLDGLGMNQDSGIPNLCLYPDSPAPLGCISDGNHVNCSSVNYKERQSIYNTRVTCDCETMHTSNDSVYLALIYSKTFISLYTESQKDNETVLTCSVESNVEHCALDYGFYAWFVPFSTASLLLLSALGVFLKYNPIDSLSQSSPNLKILNPLKSWLCNSGLVSYCSWIENKPIMSTSGVYYVIKTGIESDFCSDEDNEHESLPREISSNSVGYSYSIWRDGELSFFRLDFKNQKGFYKVNCSDKDHTKLSFCVLKISGGIPITEVGKEHVLSFEQLIDLIVSKKGIITRSTMKPGSCFYGEKINHFMKLALGKFNKSDMEKIKELVIHNVLFFKKFDLEYLMKAVFCMVKKPESCGNSEWKIYLSDVQKHILEDKCVFKKTIKKYGKSKSLNNLLDREEEAECLVKDLKKETWLNIEFLDKEKCVEMDRIKDPKEKEVTPVNNESTKEEKEKEKKKDLLMNKVHDLKLDQVEHNLVISKKMCIMKSEESKDIVDNSLKEGDTIHVPEDKLVLLMEAHKMFPFNDAFPFVRRDSEEDSDEEHQPFDQNEKNKKLICNNENCKLFKKCPKYRAYRVILNKIDEVKVTKNNAESISTKMRYCENVFNKSIKNNAKIKELRKIGLVNPPELKEVVKLEGLEPLNNCSAFNRMELKKFFRNGCAINLSGPSNPKSMDVKPALKMDVNSGSAFKFLETHLTKQINKIKKFKNISLFENRDENDEISRNELVKASFDVKASEIMKFMMSLPNKESAENLLRGASGVGYSVNKKVFSIDKGRERYSFKDIGMKRYIRNKLYKLSKKPAKRGQREPTLMERIEMNRGNLAPSTSGGKIVLSEAGCINLLGLNFREMSRICSLTKTYERVCFKDLVDIVNKQVEEMNTEIGRIKEHCKTIEERRKSLSA